MKFADTGFRPFYKSFTALLLNEELKNLIQVFPGAQQADCVLTYGYMDKEEGMKLELLAAAERYNGGFRFYEGNEKVNRSIKLSKAADLEFFWFPDQDGALKQRYKKKIDALEKHFICEGNETARHMVFLDEWRDPFYIDDVSVELRRKGLKPERRKVRIIDLEKKWLIGTLLEEPKQNFGYHKNETVAVFTENKGDNKVLLYTDMTPSMELEAKDLEDGSLLRNAVHVLHTQNSEEHYLDVLEFLRDSHVYVPCAPIFSKRDEEALNKLLEEAEKSDGIKEGMFTPEDEVTFKPQLLTNRGQYFLPAFIKKEDMGDFGGDLTALKEHFLEVIEMARSQKEEVAGIVINPFGEAFVLEARFFEAVEMVKSRLKVN